MWGIFFIQLERDKQAIKSCHQSWGFNFFVCLFVSFTNKQWNCLKSSSTKQPSTVLFKNETEIWLKVSQSRDTLSRPSKFGATVSQGFTLACINFHCHCNKLSQILWIKLTQVYHLTFLKVRSLRRLKSRCWRGGVPSEVSRGESISFFFHLPEAAHTCGCVTPTSASAITSCFRASSFTYKDPYDDTGPTWRTQDNLSISKTLNLGAPG